MGALHQALLMYGSATGGGASIDSFGRLYEEFYWPGRVQEPGASLRINYAHPSAHGLVFLALPGGSRRMDYVGGGLVSVSNESQWHNTGYDLRYGYGKGAGTDRAWYPWSELLTTITDKCTMMVRLSISSLTDGFATFISIPYANGTWVSPFVAMDFNRSGTTSSMNSFGVASDTGAMSADNVLRQYAVTRNETAITFYRDGLQHGTQKTLGSNTPVDWGARQPITIGNRSSSSSGNSMGGTFTFAAIWDRALSAGEIFELYHRPLAMVRPNF